MRRRLILLMAAIGVAVVLVSGVALADDVDCSTNPCRGTTADDHIDGTNNAEVIKARAGNDEIDGLDGADTLYGGRGDDGTWLRRVPGSLEETTPIPPTGAPATTY